MSQTDKTYNGWTNYETWAVKLWMDNDYEEYKHWQNRADRSTETYTLAQEIKEVFQNNNPLDGQANVYTELLNGALSEVNWHEIAEALIEEVSANVNS